MVLSVLVLFNTVYCDFSLNRIQKEKLIKCANNEMQIAD